MGIKMATLLVDSEWNSYIQRHNLQNESEQKLAKEYNIFKAIFMTKILRGDFNTNV